MREAILRKAAESAREKQVFFASQVEEIEACARRLGERFSAGARLFTFGNGGSACDAQHAAVEFLHPVFEKRRAVPAQALSADSAILTAVGNDTDFSRAFADQLRLHGRAGDIALGFSTSGRSANVRRGLQAAREMGLVTVAMTGGDGGRLRELAEFCFVVQSFSIHRIQEVHVTLLHVLWDAVHLAMGADDVL